MQISRREDHSWCKFFGRTIAAQIHLFGFIAATIGLGVLVYYTAIRDDLVGMIACLCFGISAILVFGVSAVYHFLHDGFHLSPALQIRFEGLDRFCIYIFIASSYSAVLVKALSHPGQVLLIAWVWVVAVLGILYTQFRSYLPARVQGRWVSTGLFVILGWTILCKIGEIYRNLSASQFSLLLCGCIIYTIGAIIYACKKPNLFPGFFGFHELWHICVVAGFAFHYVLVLRFYL